MKLRRLARALIFVDSGKRAVAARSAETMLVGTGTRMVPTVYQEIRQQRSRRRYALALWVGGITAAAALYNSVESNRFVSETQMVLSQQSSGPGLGAGAAAEAGARSPLLSLMGIGGDSSGTDEHAIVVSYLKSMDAMLALDHEIGLRKIWSAPSVDYFSQLPANASREDLLDYYSRRVTVISDVTDPVIQLKVQAFRPEDAQLIGKTLVRLSQEKLNGTFTGMREDSLRFARSELTDAEHQLTAVNEKLRVFRNGHKDIDPKSTAQAVGTVAGGLFAQLASAEAELRATLSYAQPNSPQVEALKARIAALNEQIAADRSLLAGSAAQNPYADELASYEDLLLEQKFAQDAYTSAMTYLSSSQTALDRQQSYLIDFLPPTLPQDASEPRRLRNIAIVFFASLLTWLTGTLVISALREHARQ